MAKQTPHGLATWLASMDRPDSYWRQRVTLEQIISEAKLALESPRAEESLDPWGHKITISIYVEGGSVPAEQLAVMAAIGAERELRETYDPTIAYAGASVETVQDKPEDQDASGEGRDG